MDIWHIVISLLAGVGAGFIGAVTGGAGILSIPAFIFLGLPANVAIASNSLAAFGMLASSLPQYYRAKRVHVRTGFKLAPLAVIGGYIGSKALVHTDVSALSIVVGVLLLLMVPIILLNTEKGLKTYQESKSQVAAGYIMYFLIMIYGGFLGAGAGVFAMYTLVFFLGMTYIEAKATISVPSIFLATTAFIVFLAHGLINFRLGIPMTIGMYIGGAIGAKAALEKGNAWVRVVFVVAASASAIKLLFFK